MNFVKGLNEVYYKSIIVEIDQKFQALTKKLSMYAPGMSLIPTPVTHDGEQYPYPLAAEVRQVYLYLAGKSGLPSDIVDILERICELIWDNTFLNEETFTIDWLKWERTLIGRFVRCAYIRLMLDAGESITAKQLSLMVGLTPAGVVRAITSGRLHAERDKKEWAISAKDAIEYIRAQLYN